MGNWREEYNKGETLLKDFFASELASIKENKKSISEETLLQYRKVFSEKIKSLLLPGSTIRGAEHLKELFTLSENGKACLLLVEHYSNSDYPYLYYFVSNNSLLGNKYANSILPMQSIKLVKDNQMISTFSSIFPSITIYPSRDIDKITDENKKAEIRKISNPINHKAIHDMTYHKYHGKTILVFPSGKRFRPWDPITSKKAVREVASYIKAFQKIAFVSINGNTTLPSVNENMEEDIIRKDILIYTVSPVYDSKDFVKNIIQNDVSRKNILENKQIIADSVMDELEKMHNECEIIRQELLKRYYDSINRFKVE